MYEVMVAWESPDTVAGQAAHMRDYAEIWRAADKVVNSKTLEEASSARTRIEFHLFAAPIVVGGGRQWLPDGVRLELELLDERSFGNGVIYLRYRSRT